MDVAVVATTRVHCVNAVVTWNDDVDALVHDAMKADCVLYVCALIDVCV